MSTPFEEIEFLADRLPREGEAVVVSRRDGELVCEPLSEQLARVELDSEFCGWLIYANERLRRLTTSLWAAAAVLSLSVVMAVHLLTGFTPMSWLADVGLIGLIAYATMILADGARQAAFRRGIAPVLESQMRRRGIRPFSFLAVLRQHPELSFLFGCAVRQTR